ncbi:MAG: integrase arm-type DNA-binding domain-containing protein [Methylocella sp.]
MGQLKSNSALSRLPAGKHGDGGGLYLRVKPSGRCTWFRFMRHGKARELGLGAYPEVNLAEAREKAATMRRNLAAGRQVGTAATMTFAGVARAYITAQSPAWHNAKHAAQWTSTLEHYAFPRFGHLPVAEVTTGHVLAVLQPIWAKKNETASRVRGRNESILDAAKVRGLRSGDNPAAWKGHLAHLLPPRSRTRTVKHHAALGFMETKELYLRLALADGEAARALRFLILTAARTGEVIGATWAEIDMPTSTWTIPANRMKAGRVHRVPLCAEAVAVLGPQSTGHLFKGKSPLSNMAMPMLLRRMNIDATVHGFRSTFRDWAATETAAPREVAEACLAHTLGAVERAYQRSDLFDKRRELMTLWSTMLTI